MSVETIFRVTLEELAKDGNEKAKLALELARQMPERATEKAVGLLKESQACLNEALRHNDYSWTGSTDTEIKKAQRRITDVLMIVGP